MLAVASMVGAASAQEVVKTIDFSKMRECPFEAGDVTPTLEGGILEVQWSGGYAQFPIAQDVVLEPETTYTLTAAIKGSKKGAGNIAIGNWGGDDWLGDGNLTLNFTTEWDKSSITFTTNTAQAPFNVMFQSWPNASFAEIMDFAWVVVSKGDCEPESTPLMPVDLDSAEEVAYVNFAELGSYPFDGDSAEFKDGVVVNTGDDIFNVMEGLTLEPELDYGIIARVKASSDVNVGVSMGDWGVMADGDFLAYDAWNQVIVRLGYAPVDENGNIPENCFVMFSPEDGFDGTLEVDWVKLVYFVEPEPEPEPVYKTEWSYVLDDLTGEDGPCSNVYTRIGEVGAWEDVEAQVCEGPDGVGKVFYADVKAHPVPAEGEEDPIPDHHTQFFIQYPENMFQVGDTLKIKFDYYSTVERRIDTQSHYTAGDYIMWHFIGTFTAKPEWQTYTAEVEITDELTRDGEQGCVTLNLATYDKNEDDPSLSVGKPESIFYMNHITIEKGKRVLVSGEEPVLEWQSIITNGNANEGSSVNILARVNGEDNEAPVVDNPSGAGKVFEAPIIAKTEGVNDWDSQMFIKFNQALEEGTEVKVSFDYYCSNERTVQTQAHGTPGNYHYWDMLGNLEAKPEWQSIEKTFTVAAGQISNDEGTCCQGLQAIAFNLSTSEEAGTFYINNVVVEALLPEGSAVEEIEVAPAAVVVAPAGVYNLQGVKVANSIDAVTVPGLYISNGKKVIKK